jgi:flagellar motility protein MotE (MotC chaperone)
MTKEELEKEARINLKRRFGEFFPQLTISYVMGAEPREKRIEELEHQLIHRNCLDCSNHSSKLRMRNLELEKENAELKKQRFSLRNERNTFLTQNEQYEKDLIDFNEQLTKAKEIIKEFMKYEINEYDGSLEMHFEELKKQAEQFLKDCEVEK